MKHLLNNLSEEEKQSILEQHNGGMKVFSENFNRLVGHKSGTILNEQPIQGGPQRPIQGRPNTGGGGTRIQPRPQQPTVGGREILTLGENGKGQNVQIFIRNTNKPAGQNYRGDLYDTFYIKTIETQGPYLGITYDIPSSGKVGLKSKYSCEQDAILDNYSEPTYVFGPETQEKFNEFCNKSKGIASTQNSGDVSGIA